MIQQSLLTRISAEHLRVSLDTWHWLVPIDYRPLYSTIFGDMFLCSPDGAVFFLNTLDGVLIDAADDEANLIEQMENEALRDEVLMPALVQGIADLLGQALPGYCYSAIIPPSVGGVLEPSNFHILSLDEHLSALGKIQQQVSGDPPGTQYYPVLDES